MVVPPAGRRVAAPHAGGEGERSCSPGHLAAIEPSNHAMLFKFIAVLDGLLLLIVSLFSVNRYVLVNLFKKHRRRRDVAAPIAEADLPPVTVQLPIYNEYYVAE